MGSVLPKSRIPLRESQIKCSGVPAPGNPEYKLRPTTSPLSFIAAAWLSVESGKNPSPYIPLLESQRKASVKKFWLVLPPTTWPRLLIPLA